MSADWVRMDAERVLGAMSLETVTFYESWIKLQPTRAERFESIIDGVVSEFRTALLSNPRNELDPDRRTLPLPCVRYAETLIIGALMKEMDRTISEADYAQIIRAEIMLRTFYTSAFLVSPTTDAAYRGRPSYSTRDRYAEVGAPRNWKPILAPTAPTTSSTQSDVPTTSVVAFFYWADAPLLDDAAFVEWTQSVPSAYRAWSPAQGETEFTLSIEPGAKNLVIAYPATIRELYSAVQQSTGVESRNAWLNGPYSRQITFNGRNYRLYQWLPAFAWENADSFRIRL